MARPTDMIAIQMEIQRLWTNIATTLAALVAVPETTFLVTVVDLFAPKELT